MKTTLFGIKNCDTIKKARKWLETQNVTHEFHDYRAQGLDRDWLELAESHLGWELMLNKRGTTFRQLDEADKQDLNREKALDLLIANPAMIKRPILQRDQTFHIGFKAEQYAEVF